MSKFECIDPLDFERAVGQAEFMAIVGYAHEIATYLTSAKTGSSKWRDAKVSRRFIKAKLVSAKKMFTDLNFQRPARVRQAMRQIIQLARAEAGI